MVKTKDIRNSPRNKPLRSNVIKSSRRSIASKSSLEPSAGANIRVVVRVRPTNSREQGDNFRTSVKAVDNQLLIFDPEEENQPFFYHGVQQRGRDLNKRQNKNIQFLFDRVFSPNDDNDEVFKHSTHGLIDALMEGSNCSMFVYGATGAGKTYTMLGRADAPGITFLTMDELFRKKQQLESERDFELAVSYLEVYNETVQDLLKPGGPPLQVREDNKFGVIVAGIQVKKIDQPHELFDLLEKGNKNRTQHPTDANAESSRSHAVFHVYLRMDIKSTGERRLAKLSMIDLAGSERGAATGCKGVRFTEGANINKSLLALGNCINSLADGHRHVPYRDSKLTRILKDSLGGNCRTVMIANVSPSSLSYEDTYNTLKYATRAKKIKASLRKNVGVGGDLHVSQYIRLLEERNAEVSRLRVECDMLKGLLADGGRGVKVETVVVGGGDCDGGVKGKVVMVNVVGLEELEKMYGEKQMLEEKYDKLELNKKKVEVRMEYMEAEKRRSGLYCDSPDKVKASTKSLQTITRLRGQSSAYTTELPSVTTQLNLLSTRITAHLATHPHLSQASLPATLAQLQEHAERTRLARRLDEHRDLDKLREQEYGKVVSQLNHSIALLNQCYWLARSDGSVTKAMTMEYKALAQRAGGVTWEKGMSPVGQKQQQVVGGGGDEEEEEVEEDDELGDQIDSGVTSTTVSLDEDPPLNTTVTIYTDSTLSNSTPATVAGNKRKFPLDLDGTFTLPEPATETCTNNTTATLAVITSVVGAGDGGGVTQNKGYESPAKRIAKAVCRQSPRFQNKPKRIVGTMGTAPRFTAATLASKNRRPLAVTQQRANVIRQNK